jgi:hypothetical protein
MEKIENKACPLGRIASALTRDVAPSEGFNYDDKCFPKCAWFIDGKCAIVMIAEKLNS